MDNGDGIVVGWSGHTALGVHVPSKRAESIFVAIEVVMC